MVGTSLSELANTGTVTSLMSVGCQVDILLYLHIHTPFTGGSNLYHIKLIACVQMKGHNIMHIRMSFFCCSYKLSLNCFSWSRYRWITIRLQQSRLWTRHNWLYCLHRINGLFITYYRGVTHVNCTASDGKLSEGLARLRVAIFD